MKMITKRGIFLWIMSLAFVVGLVFMTVSLVQNGDTWVMKRFNHHVYSNGELIGAGTIYDKDGDVLAETKDGDRVYSDSATTRKSTLHVVGDPKNFISTGVQSVYSARLTGYSLLFGVHNIQKYGKGNDLKLTIDRDICDDAYKALDGRKGTVGIVNYKTGEIVCSVSSPSYDVEDVPDNLLTSERYEGVYINRLLGAHYVPGSTFKLVTAICAIENIPDIYSREWVCNGEYQPESGVAIKCNANHGKHINFNDALAKSCNSTFAQIAIELGQEKLATTAKELGIGSAVTVSGTIDSYAGHFDTTDKIKLGVDALGWTGIGQGNTRIAPITMLRIVSAVANGGTAVSFNIVDSLANQAGKALDFTLPSNQLSMMNSDVAAKLKEMMRYNVTNHYGESRYKGLNLCAKSGTAQIDSNENHNIAWFVGFMDDSEHPYAFVVVIENGNSGSQTAGPVAKRVLTKLVESD
ncbi:penicillin-binding transpeptidase domain-containing protein [Eubacterium coprostanoligenes]|uniref:penicillin-binding transpeptidase domain-containing protein n=1 Tax=Eubacterium coprostanoligenes TaxID=290054 RepID=UPI00235210C2|nr:penicillin-binding transpeptidase domain-containing protein [Eubacterium coprostanoligenes]MCI6253916.1 penicillin-binding protein [Eubacterium coprostanoligenes]MDD7358094.1 penicillin-binding transpeptidase domain-containing protein [Eubacterium coprostanoligenes]MDY5399961.1 penicillin-binding transpeptidase domain-containing protein [Eubacterium coprostanoligenes]